MLLEIELVPSPLWHKSLKDMTQEFGDYRELYKDKNQRDITDS